MQHTIAPNKIKQALLVIALLFSFFILFSLSATPALAATKNTGIVTPDNVGGKDRPIAVLSTDKPIYKEGESVYLRAVLLSSSNFFPWTESSYGIIKIYSAKDAEIAQFNTPISNSTAAAHWTIPAGTPGGIYKASFSFPGSKTQINRTFEVRAYTPPKIKTQINFTKEGYGLGDTVEATLEASRAEGGIPNQAQITAIARVDGVEIARTPALKLNSKGFCTTSFQLPNVMSKGEGTLVFTIEDGGLVETASKTIPILLQTLDIEFYPEGGDLVAGLENRLYVQANRIDGKPADISAEIIAIDKSGKPLNADSVAVLATIHEGRGVSSFNPEKNTSYALRVLYPTGINKLFPLPNVKDSGVTLHSLKDIYSFDEPITVEVNSTGNAKPANITVYQREREVAKEKIKSGNNPISLDPGDNEGVLMVTVWDNKNTPLAERLVFRKPKYQLNIEVKAESIPQGDFTPGGKVRLNILTTDTNGKPVGAIVGLTVTDDAVLEMVETRDKAPNLPVMVYLENEVQDLADAEVYLDENNPFAARDIDLLLGTQGWRRFVIVRIDELIKRDNNNLNKVMAIKDPTPEEIRIAERANFNPQVVRMGRPNDPNDFDGHIMFDAVVMSAQTAPVPILEPRPIITPAPAALAPPIENNLDLAMNIGEVQARFVPNADRLNLKPKVVFVREYAHKARENRKPNERIDFTETLYWNAGIATNPRDGSATVEFDLSDSVTTFKVLADAFGNNGALGASTLDLTSLEPFRVEAKMPTLLVAGDNLIMPLTFINSTPNTLSPTGLNFKADGLNVSYGTIQKTLPQDSRIRTLVDIKTLKVGTFNMVMNAAAGFYADSLIREISVTPLGFPIALSSSGVVGPDAPFAASFMIPKEVEAGSMTTTIKAYPSPIANMEEALNALLRRPHGCFEQTSSTSFPLVMAQQYFTSHAGVDPAKIKQADSLLQESYQKLIGFESPQKGYEWFGGDPGHEALTAYGLMQFHEMSKVMMVDEKMLERTSKWLMSRRDGSGGFKQNQKSLDSFGAAPAPLANIYILWTLLETGSNTKDLKDEIDSARKIITSSSDPYILAVGINVLYLAGDIEAAQKIASELKNMQLPTGSLPDPETSITSSRGESLAIETNSLAILGWIRLGDNYAVPVEKGMTWLFEQCKSGRFGSTQSTILALKAINAYDSMRSSLKEPGFLQLVLDGKDFGKPLRVDEKSTGTVELPDFSALLASGSHKVEVKMTGGSSIPVSVEISYSSISPLNSPKAPLKLETNLSASKIAEGEALELNVTVSSVDSNVNMPLAIIGMPAGLEPRYERLKELVSAGAIDSYEIQGRQLVLYWRGIEAGGKLNVSIPMIAEFPGTYTAPASCVYAYYQDEDIFWTKGEAITITAK